MEALWNRMQLERPPNATYCIQRNKFDTTEFFNVLDKALKDLKSQELLHKEAAILSRLIYRMKIKFRNDKGVKSMSKLNRALLNYLSLSLEKEYENLKSYVEINSNKIKLPTKQMVEYVLVRIQGFAKLMARIEETSKHAAHFLKCRIALGHAWTVATIAYSVVSRIWLLSRHLIKRSCIWYNDLYQYLELFKAIGVNWLPTEFELPTNLEVWLALPWINEPISNVPSTYGLSNTMFKLIIPRDYDSDEDIALDVCNYSKETHQTSSLNPQKENLTYNNVTIGEQNLIFDNDPGEFIDRRTFNLKPTKQNTLQNAPVVAKKEKHKEIIEVEDKISQNIEDDGLSIKRENFKMTPKRLNKKRDPPKVLTLDNVKNKSELIVLLNNESYPDLDKLQWNMIRNKGKKLLNKLDASSDEANQSFPLKKAVKRIQRWLVFLTIMDDDPREVLALLNSLGFVGITAQQLKGFMKDLKLYRKVKEREKQQRKEEITKKIIEKQQSDIKRILREQRKQFSSAENYVTTDSSNSYVDSPIVKVKVQCVSSDKENKKCSSTEGSSLGTKQNGVTKSKPKTVSDPYNVKSTSVTHEGDNTSTHLKSYKKCSEYLKEDSGLVRKPRTKLENDTVLPHHKESISLQPKRPMSAPNILEHEQERVGSSQTKSILSTKTSHSGTKSFIRPWRLQPEAQKSLSNKKSDPVALYQKYQQEWKQMSFPGEAKHASLRWAIREKMLGGDPHPMPLPRKSTSMPTLKKK
nr:uncharacterized protein LOC116432596 [Nomia melanderi]